MDFNKLSLGDRIVGAAGILLLLDLLIFPWHRISIGIAGFRATATRSGLESPNSFWGILAFLLAIVVVAVVILKRLTTVQLPEIPIAWNQGIFFGSIAVLALLLIKLLAETNYLGFGAWLGILLGAAMVYGGFLVSKQGEAGVAAAGAGAGDMPPPPPPPPPAPESPPEA